MASSRSGVSPRTPQSLRLLLVGANHRTCPLDVRESLLQRLTYSRFGPAHKSPRPIEDLVLLNTCNRVEAYATASNRDAAKDTLDRAFGLPPGTGFTYELEQTEAAIHLFRVAAGLDSIALGESQIADQIRRAAEQRPTPWQTGPLAELFARAARSAPRMRRLAGLECRPTSASHAAVRYVREVIRIPQARVTLLGTGKMGRLAAEALPRDAILTIINRDYRKASEVGQRLAGRAVKFSDMPRVLLETDVLIATTSAKRRILGTRTLARACSSRERPLWIIDLGVPRNVDPSAAELEGVRIVTVDDLAAWAGPPPGPTERARVEGAIQGEAEAFLESIRPRGADRVAALRREAEYIRKSEVVIALARMPGVTEGEREILEKMSNRLVNRLLHAPTQLVRRLQAEGRDASIRDLFDRDAFPERHR